MFFAKQQIDSAGFTAVALQKTIIALTAIYAICVVISPPMHPVHWTFMALYLLVLVCGFYGAVKRVRGPLRLYWMAQFALLVLTLLAIVTSLIHELKGAHKSNAESSESKETIPRQPHANLTHLLIINVLYLVVFIVILMIKVRSILLAQKLLKQMDELPHFDNPHELEAQYQNATADYSVHSSGVHFGQAQPMPVFFVQAHHIAPTVQPVAIPVVVVEQPHPINSSNA